MLLLSEKRVDRSRLSKCSTILLKIRSEAIDFEHQRNHEQNTSDNIPRFFSPNYLLFFASFLLFLSRDSIIFDYILPKFAFRRINTIPHLRKLIISTIVKSLRRKSISSDVNVKCLRTISIVTRINPRFEFSLNFNTW